MSIHSLTLDEIGLKHGTDKSSKIHNYLHFYEENLKEFREKSFTLIEFGCLYGNSLNMWAEFFPKAKIVGVDINLKRVEKKFRNITLELADSTSFDRSYELIKKYDPLVIIEDASHIWTHQILTFETCFQLMRPGGIYVCEDLQTSYGKNRDKKYADHGIDGAQYFAKIALLALAKNKNHPWLKDAHPTMYRLAKSIELITFRFHCVLIKKISDNMVIEQEVNNTYIDPPHGFK